MNLKLPTLAATMNRLSKFIRSQSLIYKQKSAFKKKLIKKKTVQLKIFMPKSVILALKRKNYKFFLFNSAKNAVTSQKKKNH